MIHQVSGGFSGQSTDIEIQAREALYLRDELDRGLAKNTGQTYEKVRADTERDYFIRVHACGGCTGLPNSSRIPSAVKATNNGNVTTNTTR